MIWFESKTDDVADANRPTTTTGMFGWNSSGGVPALTHLRRAGRPRR